MENDRLAHIFRLQQEFDDELAEKRGIDFDKATWVQKEALAIMAELGEVIDEVNFKWWKDPKEIDDKALTEEIVDVLHFFIAMCIKAGIGPEELYQAYLRKNALNRDRQKGLTDKPGYAWKP